MRIFSRRPAVATVTAAGVVVAIVAASTFGIAAADAEPPLRDVAPATADLGSSGLISDGQRLAYMSAPTHVRVIDERLHEVASVAEPGCVWRSFGGGALLWSCQPAPGYPFGYSTVNELAGGPRVVLGPPQLPSGGHGEEPVWWGVGLRWLTVTYGTGSYVYVNRATGKVVYDRAPGRARKHARLITDVDQNDLTRAVCAPLVPRTVAGDRGFSNVAPLAYRPPVSATRSGSRLVMGRCGDTRLTVLSRCPRMCSDPVVGDRFVAWTEGTSQTRRTVYVRLADRGRTWRWQIQPSPQLDRLVAATGRRLFVLTAGMLKTVRLPAAIQPLAR